MVNTDSASFPPAEGIQKPRISTDPVLPTARTLPDEASAATVPRRSEAQTMPSSGSRPSRVRRSQAKRLQEAQSQAELRALL